MNQTRLGRKRKLTNIRWKVRVSEFEIFREINAVKSKSSNILCPSYHIIRTVRLIYLQLGNCALLSLKFFVNLPRHRPRLYDQLQDYRRWTEKIQKIFKVLRRHQLRTTFFYRTIMRYVLLVLKVLMTCLKLIPKVMLFWKRPWRLTKARNGMRRRNVPKTKQNN